MLHLTEPEVKMCRFNAQSPLGMAQLPGKSPFTKQNRRPKSHNLLEFIDITDAVFLKQQQAAAVFQGNNITDEMGPRSKNEPRRSWMMRKRQERAAMKEGLAEWQANPYFCAGRVTVPALMDTVACQCFMNT